jgi:hypothetical protein
MQAPLTRQKIVVNVGSGPPGSLPRSAFFRDWHQVRVDIEESAQPDIVADITDLSALEDNMADAVWSSHSLEHLYQHQVGGALGEFHRILNDDGFMVALVPDIQTVAEMMGTDRFHEVVYDSPAGPVTAHDMVYGFGPAVAAGHRSMAHRCGFTPSILVNFLDQTPFGEYAIRRLPSLELVIVARKNKVDHNINCAELLQALDL